MYNGRHCTIIDYDRLVLKTDQLINKVKTSSDFDLSSYIEFIAMYDEDIASKLRFHLNKDEKDINIIISTINRYIDELKSNVLVDIQEHQ